MRVLKAKRKKIVKGREKPVWNDVGLTLFFNDTATTEIYTLVDERCGEKFSCFEIQLRESSGDGGSAVQATVAPTADVPF
jgi:hypothetical protein